MTKVPSALEGYICMDDLVQVANAKEKAFTSDQNDPKLAVTYKKDTESCVIVKVPNEQDQGTDDPAMGAEEDDNLDSSAVLLEQDMKKSKVQVLFPSVYTFFSSYRSSNPDERVTPFAIVLLLILFLIYVLNQADRLVLAVTIPAGLRCELKVSECGAVNNGSVNSSLTLAYSEQLETGDETMRNFIEQYNTGGSNETEDCIHFSDKEQGLLTGKQEVHTTPCSCTCT